MTPIEFASKISIAASPDKIWQAITVPAKVAEYHLAPLKLVELSRGGKIVYGTDGTDMIVGRILEVIPGKLLVHTFRFTGSLEGTKGDPETTVTYRIESENDGAALTLLHVGFPEENQTYVNISGGWPFILEGLKAASEKG